MDMFVFRICLRHLWGYGVPWVCSLMEENSLCSVRFLIRWFWLESRNFIMILCHYLMMTHTQTCFRQGILHMLCCCCYQVIVYICCKQNTWHTVLVFWNVQIESSVSVTFTVNTVSVALLCKHIFLLHFLYALKMYLDVLYFYNDHCS